jgi:hypothetical protein
MNNILRSEDKPTRIDVASADTIYLGYPILGASGSQAKWAVKKLVQAGTVWIEYWAGRGTKEHVWDDRATLNYAERAIMGVQ